MKTTHPSSACERHQRFGAWGSCHIVVGVLTMMLCSPVVWAQKSAPSQAGAVRSGQGVKLDFVNAEIEDVAKTFGLLLGRSIVVDPRVKGQMNLSNERSVPVSAAYSQFLTALRLQGFAVVDTGGILKLVPEAEAKLQGGGVSVGDQAGAGNQIVTQIFRLNHENAASLVNVLRPLINPNNTINVNAGSNALIITDYADNLQRIGKIIAALDVSGSTDLEIIALKHAIASDLVPLLIRLTEAGAGAAATGQPEASLKTSILAEPRSNAVIVRASNQARANLVKSLIAKLDQPSQSSANGDAGNIHVVYLKNADAVKLATTLRAAMAAEASVAAPPRPSTGGAAAAPAAASAQPSTGGQIQADPSTNALIITASEPQYRQMRAVIDKLDQRRAQVFVESLIAEVNSDRAADFGIQWQGALGKKGDQNIGVVGTNFGSGGNNIISLATGAASGAVLPGKGFNFGIGRETNGVYVLGFLARFLESTGDGNVLSTPNLLTLDNEEAKIVIGQNVPFVTGQFTNTGAGAGSAAGSVNPFQTIERRDVGLTLRVKPQISENGSVRLQIFQEVSSVQASSVNSPSGLITNKRSIESSVVVEDGGIVVLGGLLSDEFAGNQEKLPGLGDIPFFGHLFKNEARTRKKTNLMVFMRPMVVRDAAETQSLSMDRYELMRAGQKALQPVPSNVLKINEAAQLEPFAPSLRPSTSLSSPPPQAAPVQTP